MIINSPPPIAFGHRDFLPQAASHSRATARAPGTWSRLASEGTATDSVMCAAPEPAALPANGGSGDSDAAQVVSRAQEEEQCSVACFTSSMPDQDPVDVARLAQFIYRHIEEAADVASMGCDQALTGLVS